MHPAADPKFLLSAAFAALVAFAANPAAAMTDEATNQEVTAETPASVLAFNQKPRGDAVTISYVYLPENGYVAIFADKDGSRSEKALGFTALEKGSHNDISVNIGDVAPGTALWASLYKDVDGDKVLNAEKDLALWPNGDPLANRFLID